MDYLNTRCGVLFCTIVSLFTFSIQMQANWSKLFKSNIFKTTIKAVKKTSTIQRILQKLGKKETNLTAPSGFFKQLWDGSLYVGQPNNEAYPIYIKDMDEMILTEYLKDFGFRSNSSPFEQENENL